MRSSSWPRIRDLHERRFFSATLLHLLLLWCVWLQLVNGNISYLEELRDAGVNTTYPAICETLASGTSCRLWLPINHAASDLPKCFASAKSSSASVHPDDGVGVWISLPPKAGKSSANGAATAHAFDVGKFLTDPRTSPVYGVDRGNYTWALSQYKRLWVPAGCRYHRFTQASLQYYLTLRQLRSSRQSRSQSQERQVANRHDAHAPSKSLNIAFFGDSVLRGVYCGINRIVSGDEIFGPNIDPICGGYMAPGTKSRNTPLTFASEGETVLGGASFPNLLRTSFTYVRFLHNHRNEIDHIKNITQRGTWDTLRMWVDESTRDALTRIDAIVIGSGAWSFYGVNLRQRDLCDWPYTHMNSTGACPDLDFEQSALSRVNSDAVAFIRDVSDLCKKNKIRLIYKNSHWNCRYGVYCADKEFEKKLQFDGSVWELWNTRSMSEQHWRDQTWDGYHFDRQSVHSLKDHYRSWFEEGFKFQHSMKRFPHQGELEMQLVNSLLNRLVLADIPPDMLE
jgi:hypothetical protein